MACIDDVVKYFGGTLSDGLGPFCEFSEAVGEALDWDSFVGIVDLLVAGTGGDGANDGGLAVGLETEEVDFVVFGTFEGTHLLYFSKEVVLVVHRED